MARTPVHRTTPIEYGIIVCFIIGAIVTGATILGDTPNNNHTGTTQQ